jgi:hypothetical protein
MKNFMNQNNQGNQQGGQQGQQIPIKATDEILKGTYANMVQIGHNQEEFVLDFMNIFPPQGLLASRIIVSPPHMKRIISALQENMKRYEEQFGKVEAGSYPQGNIGFRTE